MLQANSQEFVNQAITNQLFDEKCPLIHRGNCSIKALKQFLATSSSISKMYLVAHLFPLLLYKLKQLKKVPAKVLKKFLIGFIKSLLFAGGYIMLNSRLICLLTNYWTFTHKNMVISSCLSSVTLAFEPISRQREISLFTVNKSIQTMYNILRRRNIPVRVPNGQILVMGIAMSIITYQYFHNKQFISKTYHGILKHLCDQD